MYTKITNPILYVYDVNTNQYIGSVKFNLPPSSEKKLLDLVNSNKVPNSLLLTNADLYPTDQSYFSEIAVKTVPRRGVLRAYYTDSEAKTFDPIDIQYRYEVRAYGHSPQDINRK
jgi:hypothetical protein